MTTIEDKQQLLAHFRRERAFWESLLAEVGEDRMELPGAMGAWTIKDVMAHVVGWGGQHVARLQAALHDTTPVLPLGEIDDDADPDPINQRIYVANKDRSLHDVLADSRAFWQQFEDVLIALPERDLLDPDRFAWMKGRALGPAAVNDTASHIHDEHEPAIRAWLAQM